MSEERPRAATRKLEQLARAQFGKSLKPRELELMRRAPKGEWAICGPNADDNDSNNDPSKADKEWGREREIRAEVIRWLCVDEKAKQEVGPKGTWVYGAKISGRLDLSFFIVAFPIVLLHCRLTEDADLYGAQLPLLNLGGSWVQAINADGLDVKGEVFLSNGFHAEGEVRLLGARIGSDLDCERGTFINPSGDALSADRMNVRGDVFLRNEFYAEGVVRLPGAQIGGDLACNDSTFTKLDARAATVKGDFWWWGLKHAAGVELDLTNASVGSIGDDWDERKWPKSLVLDGFVYGRISKGPTDAASRLRWLARQDPFAPQPYRQLAKVLRERGDDDGAVTVLEEMEHLRRRQEDHTKFERLESGVFEESIGYGYNPARAIWEIVGLSALAWIVYRRSYLAGKIVPTEKDAYESFQRDGHPPEHYTPFAPLVYSVENSLPIVKLGQGDNWHPGPDSESASSTGNNWPTHLAAPRIWTHFPWLQRRLIHWGLLRDPNPKGELPRLQSFLVFWGLQPHPDPQAPRPRPSRWFTSPRFVRWFLWIQILLGWLLATLFLAGVTGIVRKE
jgi:hypothetical protein